MYGEFDRANECYLKIFRIQERSLNSMDPIICDSLSDFARILREQYNYRLSLEYELKCLLLREKFLSLDNSTIGDSFVPYWLLL